MERYRQNMNRMRMSEMRSVSPMTYSRMSDGCGCSGSRIGNIHNTESDECTGLAMAYVPRQTWMDIYSPEKAICRGTLFAQLDKPFTGRRGCK